MVSAGKTTRSATVAALLGCVRQRLAEAGIAEARLEGELLVRHALGVDAAALYARLREPAPASARERLRGPLARRLRREPLAYILGARDFYGRRFRVDARVLIPRPETELLVDAALETARRWKGPLRIADIGTGSGALAVTLACELPDAEVRAADISQEALEVARANAEAHGAAARVSFACGDLTASLAGRFDIVVANLPYVRSDRLAALQPEIAYEPRLALDGGADGMRFIGRLIRRLPETLSPRRGAAFLEIDPPLTAAVADAARRAFGEAAVEIRRDLAGLERCAVIRAGAAR